MRGGSFHATCIIRHESLKLFENRVTQSARFSKDSFTAISIFFLVVAQDLFSQELAVLGSEKQKDHLGLPLRDYLTLLLDDIEARLRARVTYD